MAQYRGGKGRRNCPVAPVAAAALMLLVSACGPMQEKTPEPGDSETIKALTRRLGLTPSWADKITARVTGEAPDRANGVILYDWLRRRRATLGGTLEVYQTPATDNPGKIGETLKWERGAQAADSKTRERIDSYWDVIERMQSDCPALVQQESDWFSKYQEAHAKGTKPAEVNWDLRALNLVKPCEGEKNREPVSQLPSGTSASDPAQDEPFKPKELALIRLHGDAESNCRGSYDEEVSEQGCRDRDRLLDKLNAAGICWGKENQFPAEYEYHRCAPGSIGYQPAAISQPSGNTPVFACSIGAKQVSVRRDGGAYVYRIGTPTKAELTLKRRPPDLYASLSFGTLDGDRHLRFTNGRYSYVLFFKGLSDDYGTSDAAKWSGLAVFERGKRLSKMQCESGSGFDPDWSDAGVKDEEENSPFFAY